MQLLIGKLQLRFVVGIRNFEGFKKFVTEIVANEVFM